MCEDALYKTTYKYNFSFLLPLAQDIAEAGGKAYIVGGAVRDVVRMKFFSGYNHQATSFKDIDIEVFGLDEPALMKVLSKYELVNETLIGKSFGVFKVCIDEKEIDVAIPRRESKTGELHTDFAVVHDPHMSVYEAASRRDFTMNAMYFDLIKMELVDPYNGCIDLQNNRLRHTSPRFSEDPLRVLRGIQFAARFGLDIHPETAELCKSLVIDGISRERIEVEFTKFFGGACLSTGFKALKETGWNRYFPELDYIVDGFSRSQTPDMTLVSLYIINYNAFKEVNHLLNFVERVWKNYTFTARVRAAMACWDNYKKSGNETQLVLESSIKLGGFQYMHNVMPYHTMEDKYLYSRLDAIAKENDCFTTQLKPMVRGKDLIALGFPPGKLMGNVVTELFDTQISGNLNRDNLFEKMGESLRKHGLVK